MAYEDDDDLVEALASRGLAILRFGDPRGLAERRHGEYQFSLTFGHEGARAVRQGGVVLVAFVLRGVSAEMVPGEDHINIGLVRTIGGVTTFESRVNFHRMERVFPDSLSELLGAISDPHLAHHARRMLADESRYVPVSEGLARGILRELIRRPENRTQLSRLAFGVSRPRRVLDARALQYDAINLAMRAFGATGQLRSEISSGESLLGSIRLQEDAVIEHDSRSIPEWEITSCDFTGRAMFRRGDAVLEVVTANKRPLEELFGVDLVYLHHQHAAMVMVQYKMLEPILKPRSTRNRANQLESQTESWYVSMDDQFKSEVARMERFDMDLAPDGPYRLNSSAFFLKFVRRDALLDGAGVILSLGHLQQLLRQGALVGPRGGLRLGFKDLAGHYLRAEAFVELLRSGYIGTRAATTQQLTSLMDAALLGGRAVVAAVERGWSARK